MKAPSKTNETPALKSGWRILLMLQTAVKAKTDESILTIKKGLALTNPFCRATQGLLDQSVNTGL
jgi:hypothetical protein